MPKFIHPKALIETKNIGEGSRIWAFAHIMEHVTIGKDCNIGDHCFIEESSVIGDRVTIKNGVSIWKGLTIENDVFIGPNAVFTNDLLPISRKVNTFEETLIQEGACIGANATILCGITIGAYSFIGAGAVITQSTPNYALVFGNPGKIQGFLCSCREKLVFHQGEATCVCGKKFKQESPEKISLVS